MYNMKKRAMALAGTLVMLLVMACQSPVEPETQKTRYSITVKNAANGTVSAGRETAKAGEVITLTIMPKPGYETASVRVTGAGDITLTGSGRTRMFTMPAEDVSVTAAFAAVSTGPVKYGIRIGTMTGGSFDSFPADSQYKDGPVRLTARPDAGKKYRPGSLKVRGMDSTAEIKTTPEEGCETEWTFTMPSEDVAVDAGFIDEETELYDIIITQPTNGKIECSQTNAVAGDTVTLTLLPQDGDYRYRPGSLVSTPDLELTDIGEEIWIFTMPEESVSITAEFEEIPSYTIAIPDWGENGVITVSPFADLNTVREGRLVTVTLAIADPANYRYIDGSISITATSDGGSIDFEPDGDLRWVFTMPAEDVTIDAVIELIPWFDITLTGDTGNGSFSISGVETTGPYEGKAREGTPITITAIPAPGYKLTDNGLVVTPPGAVTVVREVSQPVWTFDMADTDLEIGVEFGELGLLDIYKGGARRGITIGKLSDESTVKYYKDSIDMEAEEPGRNGSQRVIKITHAVNTNGNAAQHSFALFSDTEIDLEAVAALSFWAKANKQLNIRFIGFGDADPNKRVVYIGENNNHSIPITTEWKRYIVPVPAFNNGQKTTRVFFFNASLAIGNYIYLDDIEFIESGVTLTEITMTDANNGLLYGATDAAKILKGVPLKLTYTCDDGTVVTLKNEEITGTLKYNLSHWLIPFIGVGGNVTFSDGIITPKEKGTSNAFTLSVNIPGTRSNSMTAAVIDGLLLDDFEDIAGTGNVTIPATPAEGTGYLWHTSSGSPVVTAREFFTVDHKEIHSGLRAGSWRPTLSSVSKARGGKNFDPMDAAGYNTLIFRIKVTVGGGNTVPQKNTVFTFELKNGGTLTNKTSGSFYAHKFTYNTDDPGGWQEVTMPLADFAALGLDTAAITGFAFGVVDNQGTALRIMLDDIAIY